MGASVDFKSAEDFLLRSQHVFGINSEAKQLTLPGLDPRILLALKYGFNKKVNGRDQKCTLPIRNYLIIDNSSSTIYNHDVDAFYYGQSNSIKKLRLRERTKRLVVIVQRALQTLAINAYLGIPTHLIPLNDVVSVQTDTYGHTNKPTKEKLSQKHIVFDGRTRKSFEAAVAYVMEVFKKFSYTQYQGQALLNFTPLYTILDKYLPNTSDSDRGHIAITALSDGKPSDCTSANDICHLIQQRAVGRQMNVTVSITSGNEKLVETYDDLVDSIESTKDNPVYTEVITGYELEKKQVEKHGDLNYPLSLHRLRDTGMLAHTALDNIDERPLTYDEIYNFVSLLQNKKTLCYDDIDTIISELPQFPTQKAGAKVDVPLLTKSARNKLVTAIIFRDTSQYFFMRYFRGILNSAFGFYTPRYQHNPAHYDQKALNTAIWPEQSPSKKDTASDYHPGYTPSWNDKSIPQTPTNASAPPLGDESLPAGAVTKKPSFSPRKFG